jgi:hypothetical protein
MKTLKTIIVILIALGFIFCQQTIGAEKKPDSALIPPDNYVKIKKQTGQKVNSKTIVKKQLQKSPRPKGSGTPDLLASIISIVPGPTGLITIRGRITNIGSSDFISASGQAAGQIVIHLKGVTGPSSLVYLENDPITRLARHHSVNLSGTYRLPEFQGWGHENFHQGECEAELDVDFIVWVALDPDIKMDGNFDNDDSNYSNNEVRRSSMTMPEVRDYKTPCLN